MTYLWTVFVVLVVGFVPGALIFRLPFPERARRAKLPAEERVFWNVVLSLAVSSCVALGLAAAGLYRFDRLLAVNGAFSLLILISVRGYLRLGASASRPTWTALIPIALLVGGLSIDFLVPPAEYIIGGKDPGIYMNEGIRIAQRGALVYADDVVRTIPAPFRSLFFRTSPDVVSYYSNRFMGFFVLNGATGTVVGQFPHLYPVWIAIAYGINGLSGAREVTGFCAVLGLLAVYFAGTRMMGRAAAATGAALLAINVVEVWYARYPNAEMLMQPLLFAGLLALMRAELDRDRFFAPVAALLFVLCVFTHLTGALVVIAVAAATLLVSVKGGRPRLSFFVPLVGGTILAGVYLARYIPPYFEVPLGFVQNLRPLNIAVLGAALVAAAGLWLAARHIAVRVRLKTALAVLTAIVWICALYAMFFRWPTDALAPHDAGALRTFTSFYLSWYGLAGALIGFALMSMMMPEAAAFLFTVAAFSLVFFYKIRIVPEHFWAARRFLAVVLPGALLLVGAAAFGRSAPDARTGRRKPVLQSAREVAGIVLVLALGWHYWSATRPLLHHVEYAGLIPHLEQLASSVGDDDLVLVESRNASDAHVLALPLAYVYARNVLVFAATDPDKAMFREFLDWARTRYKRIFFAGGGGGGTELLSRSMSVAPIRGERFQVPEYESLWNEYPRAVRFKEFDLSLYEFLPPGPAVANGFALDVGAADDLYVRRFYAKEQSPAGFSFRWTRDLSFVSVVGTRPDDRTITFWMADGGRPASAGPATVEVFLGERRLGAQVVGPGLHPYRFSIPPDLAAAMAQSQDAAQLRIVTRTWSPKAIGAKDDRELGVMLDRIDVE